MVTLNDLESWKIRRLVIDAVREEADELTRQDDTRAAAVLTAYIDEQTALQRAIEESIDRLKNPVERQIIRLRFMPPPGHRPPGWYKISQIVGYSEKAVYNHRAKALEELSKPPMWDLD